MSLLDLDPRSLVVLHLVAHSGSMSAAARELGWTHPAVAQHVRGLERRLGLTLVERAGRGVRLTAAGEALCRHADVIAAELSAATAAAAAQHRRAVSVVRVAAFPTACATFVVEAINALHAQAPDLRVEVLQAEPPQAVPALMAGEVDVAVVFDTVSWPPPSTRNAVPDTARSGVTRISLGEDELVSVLPARDARASRAELRLRDLAHDVVIAGCPTCQARFVRAAHEAGIDPALHHQVTDDYVLMQAMVAAGQGVAVLPALALRAHHRDDVVALPLTPAMRRPTSLLVRRLEGPVQQVADALERAHEHVA